MPLYRLMNSGSTMGMFLQILPAVCLAGILYIVFRHGYLCKRHISVVWKSEIIRFLFVCYLTGLISLILTPNNLWSHIWASLFLGHSSSIIGPLFQFSYNLVPSVWQAITGKLVLGSWVQTMLILNTLMFVPMGVFLPLVFPKAKGRTFLLLAIATPLAIELLQPVVGRSFDVDDLISNFTGILLGYLLTAICGALVKKNRHLKS